MPAGDVVQSSEAEHLKDYQVQLALLNEANKKRCMMDRQRKEERQAKQNMDGRSFRAPRYHNCSICERKSFKVFNDLQRHMKSVHDLHQAGDIGWTCHEAGCKSTGKVWSRRDNVKQHMIRVHGQSNDADLKLCETVYRTKASLREPESVTSVASVASGQISSSEVLLSQPENYLHSLGDIFQEVYTSENMAYAKHMDLEWLHDFAFDASPTKDIEYLKTNPQSETDRVMDDRTRCQSATLMDDGGCASPSQISEDDSVDSFPELTVTQEKLAGTLANIAGRMYRYCIASPGSVSCVLPAGFTDGCFVQHPALGSTNNKRPANSSQAEGNKKIRLGSAVPITKRSTNKVRSGPFDDDEGSPDEDPTALSASVKSSFSQSWACPYRKKDPLKFGHGHYRLCATGHFVDIPALKQHLKRKHEKPEFYCATCYATFNTDPDREVNSEERNRHERLRNCQAESINPFADKMTLKQAEDIRRKRRAPNTDTEKWYEIFVILFPGSTEPNSPFNTPEEEVYIRTVYWFFRLLGPLSYEFLQHLQSSELEFFLTDNPLTPDVIGRAYELFQQELLFARMDLLLIPPLVAPNVIATPSQSTQSYTLDASGHGDSLASVEQQSMLPTTPMASATSSSPFRQAMGRMYLSQNHEQRPLLHQDELEEPSFQEQLLAAFTQPTTPMGDAFMDGFMHSQMNNYMPPETTSPINHATQAGNITTPTRSTMRVTDAASPGMMTFQALQPSPREAVRNANHYFGEQGAG